MAGAANRILCNTPTRNPCTHFHRHCPFSNNLSWFPFLTPRITTSCSSLVVSAASKKFSSRTGKFDSKNKRSSTKTKKEAAAPEIETLAGGLEGGSASGTVGDSVEADDGYFLPELPGEEPDFWEGTQWDTFGFVVQYLWAFGIVFALIACGIAVATYNEGATDFKDTPVYKESVQSRELLEEPEETNSDVFESNPTEEAPSLE